MRHIDNGLIFQVVLNGRRGKLNDGKYATFINKFENKDEEGGAFSFRGKVRFMN